VSGTHNYWLVLLSVIVATMASFVALVLAMRVAPSQQPERRRLSLAVGVLAIGSGMWAMHFIGMLGLRLPVAVSYDLWLTLLSLGLAIAGSGFSLATAARDRLRHTDRHCHREHALHRHGGLENGSTHPL
jgi:NO-binding membrane sensor protein with MHYT domain